MHNDGSDLNRHRRSEPDGRQTSRARDLRRKLNMATWNVRTLFAPGRLQQVIDEAQRLQIDILGLSEVRWTGQGRTVSTNGWEIWHSGDDTMPHRGVAFLISKAAAKSILKVDAISDRIIVLRIDAKPRPITLILVYMPTTEAPDEAIQAMHAQLQLQVNQCPSRDRLVIMGDFNAQVGEQSQHPSCGSFGYGRTNERSETLLDWAVDNNLKIVNTCFRHRRNQRYTWVAPNGRTKTLID